MSKLQYEFGHRMEDYVHQYLECVYGWELFKKNWHSMYGELDLVLWNPHQKEWVLIEVKATKSERYSHLIERISPSKIQKILKTKYIFEKKEQKILEKALFFMVVEKKDHLELEQVPLWNFLEP